MSNNGKWQMANGPEKRKRYGAGKWHKGFTLLEVVISLGIVLVVIGAFVGIQVLVRQAYQFSFKTHITIDQANGVAQQLIRNLREARPSETGTYPLEIVSDQELAFYSDIDNDNQAERVRYFLAGTILKRGVIEPTGFPVSYPGDSEAITVLTEAVRNGSEPVFYYYNQGWPSDTANNPLPQAQRLSQTRLIRLSLKINAQPERPQAEFTVSPTVQIRNLKDNL